MIKTHISVLSNQEGWGDDNKGKGPYAASDLTEEHDRARQEQ